MSEGFNLEERDIVFRCWFKIDEFWRQNIGIDSLLDRCTEGPEEWKESEKA